MTTPDPPPDGEIEAIDHEHGDVTTGWLRPYPERWTDWCRSAVVRPG